MLGSGSGIETSSAYTSCARCFPKKRQFASIGCFVRKATRTNAFNVPHLMSALPEGTWVVKTESWRDSSAAPLSCSVPLNHSDGPAGRLLASVRTGLMGHIKTLSFILLKCLHSLNLFGQFHCQRATVECRLAGRDGGGGGILFMRWRQNCRVNQSLPTRVCFVARVETKHLCFLGFFLSLSSGASPTGLFKRFAFLFVFFVFCYFPPAKPALLPTSGPIVSTHKNVSGCCNYHSRKQDSSFIDMLPLIRRRAFWRRHNGQGRPRGAGVRLGGVDPPAPGTRGPSCPPPSLPPSSSMRPTKAACHSPHMSVFFN